MKNILLLFLSEIHLNDKSREFRISPYRGLNGEEYKCIQTNESAIDYVMDYLGKKLDALFFFSTKKTKEELSVVIEGELVTKTHVEWFTDRIIEKHPELEGAFNSVDYNEDKDTEEGIRQVTEMTERIKKYLDDSSDKDIRIYADMTGGFRHASMMMLSVMQLLNQYKGIRIEKVLYSNWKKKEENKTQNNINEIQEAHGEVEDVTELHRMFTLVSGTDEFVNFGSVKEIDHYFQNRKKSPSLEALIDTMRSFSDAIKICRTNKIEKLVQQLQYRINDFSQEPIKTVHEKIFEQITTILKEEYGKLLSPKVTQIDIIEWCIKKGFLQQAMTLCTEWLPFMLVNKKICYTDDIHVKMEALKLGTSLHRAWEQAFIISYTDCKTGYTKAIDYFMESKDAKESAEFFPNGKERLLQLFQECNALPDIFTDVKKGKITTRTFGKKAPMIDKACVSLWKIRKEAKQISLKYEEFLMKKFDSINHFLKQIKTLPEDKYNAMLDIKNEETIDDFGTKGIVADNADNDNSRWQDRRAEFARMFDSKIMKSDYPFELMIYFLKGFHEIRANRNQINHAASEQENGERPEVTNKKLEEMMLSYLSELKKY